MEFGPSVHKLTLARIQPGKYSGRHEAPAGNSNFGRGTFCCLQASCSYIEEEKTMGFGRGALLWLLGIPLPIIVLLALFWHH